MLGLCAVVPAGILIDPVPSISTTPVDGANVISFAELILLPLSTKSSMITLPLPAYLNSKSAFETVFCITPVSICMSSMYALVACILFHVS